MQRILDVLGAVAAALLAFTAVPAVLVVVVGDPLSGGLGHAWASGPRDALCVVTVAAWIAWVACCAQLLRGVIARVRGGDVRNVRLSVLDLLAARIAIGVLAVSSVGGSVALSASAGATAPSSARAALTAIAAPGAFTQNSRGAPESRPELAGTSSYAVRAGDTLWSIADDQLDDGADWTALAALNLGRDMGGGERFVDPDHIRPGWRLRLPDGSVRHRDGPTAGTPSVTPGGNGPTHLPELVALGMGSLACAALARRARRRERPERFRGELHLGGSGPEGAVDAAALLIRFGEVPSLSALETANGMLGRSLAGEPGAPTVRAVTVGPAGVTFWLAAAHHAPPEGFEAVAGGTGWRVSHDLLDQPDVAMPYVPVVLPVGDDEEGTWLVALGPGHVLPLLGAEAPALAQSIRTAAASWEWADTLVVTDDAADPELLSEAAADPRLARQLLFFGDPRALAQHVAARTAVVTTASVPASDLTVLVDRHGATIHPLSRVVRPHLQLEERARDIETLLAPAYAVPAADVVRRELSDDAADTPAGRRTGTAAAVPGQVDVRLMTMTPRLDGLTEALPANRARRAVELVAYLALHQPDVITSDRLRTRVLGSSDSDAAAKTLFNTAYAARRAMGLDPQGEPLFPPGTRAGTYHVTPEVTVDVRRAMDLVAEGRLHDDPAVAIAHFRAALDLVEGEPLANALSGYTWWEAEGHGGRLAAVLVDAACAMAELAAEARLFELARWGLDQARLVEPYSEALSRAGMELAAAEGDVDRLRYEWRDCQRRLDALDPGSSPSPRTETLYGELSRALVVGAASAGASSPVPRLGPGPGPGPGPYAPAVKDGAPSAAP